MYTFHVTDMCLWCHCTCMFAFYGSSHLAGSVPLADSVKSMHQLISHPTDRSCEGNSSGLKTDIGPMSVLCRFNMISMSGRYSNRHRTYIKTYCKIWAARYRLYVGSISFLCRADIVVPTSDQHQYSLQNVGGPRSDRSENRHWADIDFNIGLTSVQYHFYIGPI